MAPYLSVLFVCLGNICRSPLAEAAFRAEAEKKGLKIRIDSAGTGSWHIGEPPDKRAQLIAKEHNQDISHYKGRQITEKDFSHFTHIIAMDHSNLNNLRKLQPKNSSAELALFLDFVEGRKGQAISDPYYGDMGAFKGTWEDVQEGAQNLVNHLIKKQQA